MVCHLLILTGAAAFHLPVPLDRVALRIQPDSMEFQRFRQDTQPLPKDAFCLASQGRNNSS
jgi:hypothetical protein